MSLSNVLLITAFYPQFVRGQMGQIRKDTINVAKITAAETLWIKTDQVAVLSSDKY